MFISTLLIDDPNVATKLDPGNKQAGSHLGVIAQFHPIYRRRVPNQPRQANCRLVPLMIRLVMSALAACFIGHAAFAHAHLHTASPAVDSTVSMAPKEVAIAFSEAVEPRFSTIEVSGPDGGRVDQGGPHSFWSPATPSGLPLRWAVFRRAPTL